MFSASTGLSPVALGSHETFLVRFIAEDTLLRHWTLWFVLGIVGQWLYCINQPCNVEPWWNSFWWVQSLFCFLFPFVRCANDRLLSSWCSVRVFFKQIGNWLVWITFQHPGVAYSKHIVHIYSYQAGDELRNHLEVCVGGNRNKF